MNRRDRLLARARQGYRVAFGDDPHRFYAAPGRVNLIGEHVDYNCGLVLPCAIDRETIVALGPGPTGDKGGNIEAIAIDMGNATDRFLINRTIARGANNWQNHVRGVAHFLLARGYELKPARIAIAGDIPIGAGLSSSASLGVSIALALAHYSNLNLSATTLATIAQEAENHFVGCACGIMDQMASAAAQDGHALLLDCRNLQHMPIPIATSLAVIVIDSGVSRQLTSTAFNTRRAECRAAVEHFGVAALRDLSLEQLDAGRAGLAENVYRRARHVVGEIARVEPFAVALVNGDTAALSHLMRASHASLRDDYEVSVPLVDALVETVEAGLAGRGGVRLTGAGFGGCIVAVAHKDAVDDVFEAVDRGFNANAEFPAQPIVIHPSDGAARIG
jgi:galactokinase